MTRAVLDTNIVISAIFWKGLPRLALEAALDKRFISLTSESLTAELKRVLAYAKFAQQIARQALDVDRLIGDYLAIVISVMPIDVPDNVVRDPKD